MSENETMKPAADASQPAPQATKAPHRRMNGCVFYLLHIVAMGIVLVLIMLLAKCSIDTYTHQGEAIQVPDLTGMNYTDAIRQADALGLQVRANDSTYIKDQPAGSVVLQQPKPGSNVKDGRIIYVTINSYTLPRVEIPDLVENCSYREAQAKLKALDFVVLEPKLVEGEKDWVYGIQCDGRNLSAGDMVARESRLTLLIGNGLVGEDADMNDYIEDYNLGRIMEEPDDMEEVPFEEMETE